MRVACWTPKVTNTHSEYAIIRLAFPLVFTRTYLSGALYVRCMAGFCQHLGAWVVVGSGKRCASSSRHSNQLCCSSSLVFVGDWRLCPDTKLLPYTRHHLLPRLRRHVLSSDVLMARSWTLVNVYLLKSPCHFPFYLLMIMVLPYFVIIIIIIIIIMSHILRLFLAFTQQRVVKIYLLDLPSPFLRT